MARNTIDIGVEGNDGTGDSIRESFRKVNANFTELYAVFGQGGQISFTDLGDAPSEYSAADANKVVAIKPDGSSLAFKTITSGGGISISHNADQIILTNTGAKLEDDETPQLSYHLNAQGQMIGNLRNPDPIAVNEFNNQYGTSLNTDGRDFAISKGYADSRFVNIAGDTMTGYLNVPAGATGSQVPRASDTVLKSGSEMKGVLYLNDHPTPLDGFGSPNGPSDLQAATKYYVDNSSYTSEVNLFVSTSGSDDQTYTPLGKEGRSWGYAFKTINKACQYAEETMRQAPWETGPYRQLIAYNEGAAFSVVNNVTIVNGNTRLFFTNNAGSRVDQGQETNIDIIPGKLVVGRSSGAKGFIYQYYGPDGATNSDYLDLQDVDGYFFPEKTLTGATWAYSNNLITITKANHGLSPGQTITITGAVATTNAPNGVRVIGAVTTNTISFNVSSVPTGVASGLLTIKAEGENLEFGEPVKSMHISIFVESGIYYEDYPIRIPENCAIVGDEFRRTIIRPADRPSKSPWADIWFRRDTVFDGLTIAHTNYGYHYLTDPSDRASTPKNNKEIDVFLCNDASIVRQITFQGHGGFAMVLDPQGQVLSKSPYAQQSGCFSGSINKQRFAGGQFVDGFAGNLSVKVKEKLTNNSILVTGAERAPLTPCSFVVAGETYKIDAYQNDGSGYGSARTLLLKNKEFIKAEVIGYLNSNANGSDGAQFVFDRNKCARDIGYIIDALSYDLLFGTNFRSVKAGLSYYIGTTYATLTSEKDETISALLLYVKPQIELILENNSTARTSAVENLLEIVDIITNGPSFAAAWNLPDPSWTTDNKKNAKKIILDNLAFLKAEVIAFINEEYENNEAEYPSFTYDPAKCIRDIDYIVHGALYDFLYGGNSQTVDAGLRYYNNSNEINIANQTLQTTSALNYLKTLLSSVIKNSTIPLATLYQLDVVQVSGTAATDTEVSEVNELISIINTIILEGAENAPTIIDISTDNVDSSLIDSRSLLTQATSSIKTGTIDYLIQTYTYNQVTCARDTGYIVDAIAHDIYYDGNLKTIEAGLAYFNGAASSKFVLQNQLDDTVDAIDYIKTVILKVIDNQSPDTRYQSEIPQYIDTNISDGSNASSTINTLFSELLGILNGNNDSNNVVVNDNARTLLVENKEFIKAQVIAYVNNRYKTTISATATNGNITCASTANLSLDMPVRFSGTSFGGILPDVTYYIKTIAGSVITVTTIPPTIVNGAVVRGATSTWATSTGTMTLSFYYDETYFANKIGFSVANISADLLYNGKYNTVSFAQKYYSGDNAPEIITQKTQIKGALEYAKLISANILNQTTPSTVYPSNIEQYKNILLNGTVAVTSTNLLFDQLLATIDAPANVSTTIGNNVIVYPVYKLVLSTSTPYTGTYPAEIMLLSAGNTSMLSNDYTQINDLGYGLVATNNGLIEAVSVFSYYCWTAMYSMNGGQIRSLNSSNAHGEYGIVAEGSDPLEVPDNVALADNSVQVARVYKQGPFATGSAKDETSLYIYQHSYAPYNISEIEINHGADASAGGVVRYEVANCQDVSSQVPINVSFSTKQQSGAFWYVTFSFTTPGYVPKTGVMYTVSGNSNTNYNGVFLCEAPSGAASTATSVVLKYSSDPGTFGTGVTTVWGVGNILRLNLSTAGNYETSTAGLQTSLANNANVILRLNQNFKFKNVENVRPTRPSTALTFTKDPNDATSADAPVYRVIAYNIKSPLSTDLGTNEAILTFDTTYNYVKLFASTAENLSLTDTGSKTLGAKAGDTAVAVTKISESTVIRRLNSGDMIFAWDGKLHQIQNYTDMGTYGIIRFTDVAGKSLSGSVASGLQSSLVSKRTSQYYNSNLYPDSIVNLRAGVAADEVAEVVVKISTCRVTGHDFLYVGSGSYNQSNFPTKIYGDQKTPSQENEVQERTRGRCFYVTSDQDGIFRVGRFFTVDQGTGRVTFSASIALSNLDGIGFKRGVVVSEFSNDDTFTDLANDTVPVESAISGYIDRRLGVDRTGTAKVSNQIIGPGFMDRAGTLAATNDLSIGGHKLTNVGAPASDSDAATKLYVDQQEMSDESVDTTTAPAKASADLLLYNGTKWTNFSIDNTSTDIEVSLLSPVSDKKLKLTIKSGTIVNADVNASAAIAQSKLSLNAASTRANATGITQANLGVASFNDSTFTATNGWISLKDSSSTTTGVLLDKVQYIGGTSILGRRDGVSGPPTEISPSNIVTDGDGIKNASFTSDGAMTVDVTTGEANLYSVTEITTSGAKNSLVKTGNNGEIDVQQLKIDNSKVLDITTTTLEMFTPGGVTALSATGNTDAAATMSIRAGGGLTVYGSISTSGAGTNISAIGSVSGATGSFTTSVTTPALTTGAATTAGTITGNWTLTSNSKLQATYADLAEYYEGDQEYAPGTVLVFGGTKEVTTTNIFGDRRVAGVVSNTAAYSMNSECPGIKNLIALQGRVPVKVIGKVQKGDILVAAAKPGYAIVNNNPSVGTIIGKALQDKFDANDGVIEVAVGRL